MPASDLLWFAMPMEVFLALTAACSPFSFRHIRLTTPHRLGTNLYAFLLPDAIMAVIRSNQRMSDFMLDRIHDFFGRILEYKENRKFDGAAMINAQPQRSLAAIEAKSPIVQAVRRQKLQGQLADFLDSMG
jgi:hypothetical protein